VDQHATADDELLDVVEVRPLARKTTQQCLEPSSLLTSMTHGEQNSGSAGSIPEEACSL
jgi:hypothetical protein